MDTKNLPKENMIYLMLSINKSDGEVIKNGWKYSGGILFQKNQECEDEEDSEKFQSSLFMQLNIHSNIEYKRTIGLKRVSQTRRYLYYSCHYWVTYHHDHVNFPQVRML